MITTVILPALRCGSLGDNAVEAFEAIERRFVWQARSTVLLVGFSGLYMVWRTDLWDRFSMISFWWMHAMVGIWLLFAFVLFVAEPFILRSRVRRFAEMHPDIALQRMQRSHWILLTLSSITILGAAAGSHGWFLF
jgi:cytochrome b subunit of formate dehydrogenase